MTKSGVLTIFLTVLCLNPSACACFNLWELAFGPRLGAASHQERTQSAPTFNQRITEKIVKSHGYRLDTHLVASETGHILKLHRIPRGRSPENGTKSRPIALIHHGLLGCSDMWLIRGPRSDLPYLLADAGYDVWLFNIRGNVHSRRHKTLNPDTDEAYWDFGIEEIGYYDLPATIDYILNITNQESVIFLGHSIGSSSALLTCALRPEYNRKIRLFVALGPLANVRHEVNSMHRLIFFIGEGLLNRLVNERIYEVLPRRVLASRIIELMCREGSPTHGACLQLIFMVVGSDVPQLDQSVLGNFVQYYPSGTSIKLMINVLQYYITGNFARFDFGSEKNLLHYNSTVPPVYDLTKVTTPVAIFYGKGDLLVTEEDVDELAVRLPNVEKFKIPYKNFNHLDFVLAINSTSILYENILKTMDKFR